MAQPPSKSDIPKPEDVMKDRIVAPPRRCGRIGQDCQSMPATSRHLVPGPIACRKAPHPK
jgi:hypothetical protein